MRRRWTRLGSELLKVARELAAASESRLLHTTAEIAELEEQLRQLRAQRDGQLDAQGRLNSYRPKVGATSTVSQLLDRRREADPAQGDRLRAARRRHHALSQLRARLRHLVESVDEPKDGTRRSGKR